MARIKNYTETMDEQAHEAYILCVELLEELYDGQKVTQATLINAVAKAWKIHNRFAAVHRHNVRLDYARSGWDRSREMIWSGDPEHIRLSIRDYINVEGDFFPDESDNTSLICLARELLMEAVDYPTRKIMEQWKVLEKAHKEAKSILGELKYHKKEYTEPPMFGRYEDIPEPEVDTYLAGIELGIEATTSTLEKVDRFDRWTKKTGHQDVRVARRWLDSRVEQEAKYIDAVLEKYNGYPIEGLANLHDVTVRIARQWCEKGLIEARQINEAWLINKDLAESFVPPKAKSSKQQAA